MYLSSFSKALVREFSCIIFSSGLLRNFLSTSLLIGMAQVVLAVNITCTAPCSTVECGTIYYCR